MPEKARRTSPQVELLQVPTTSSASLVLTVLVTLVDLLTSAEPILLVTCAAGTTQ